MYCSKCVKEVMDELFVCPYCGCVTNGDIKSSLSDFGATKKTQTSVILGIIGIVFAWVFALVGYIISIIGIILGIKEYKETDKMTGLILSIIGEVCSIFSSIIGAVVLSGLL